MTADCSLPVLPERNSRHDVSLVPAQPLHDCGRSSLFWDLRFYVSRSVESCTRDPSVIGDSRSVCFASRAACSGSAAGGESGDPVWRVSNAFFFLRLFNHLS